MSDKSKDGGPERTVEQDRAGRRWRILTGQEPKTDEAVLKPIPANDIEQACEILHDAYEAAAAEHGWKTQEASRKPWSEVPEANKATMRSAVGVLMSRISVEEVGEPLTTVREKALEAAGDAMYEAYKDHRIMADGRTARAHACEKWRIAKSSAPPASGLPTYIYSPDSDGIIDGSGATWDAAGYNDPDRVAERFRGDLRRVWIAAWHESRMHLIGKSVLMSAREVALVKRIEELTAAPSPLEVQEPVEEVGEPVAWMSEEGTTMSKELRQFQTEEGRRIFSIPLYRHAPRSQGVSVETIKAIAKEYQETHERSCWNDEEQASRSRVEKVIEFALSHLFKDTDNP